MNDMRSKFCIFFVYKNLCNIPVSYTHLKRQFFAASNSEITYICIQVKENSLEGYTATDAVIY